MPKKIAIGNLFEVELQSGEFAYFQFVAEDDNLGTLAQVLDVRRKENLRGDEVESVLATNTHYLCFLIKRASEFVSPVNLLGKFPVKSELQVCRKRITAWSGKGERKYYLMDIETRDLSRIEGGLTADQFSRYPAGGIISVEVLVEYLEANLSAEKVIENTLQI